ncbi:MAG TPA: amidohydrolase family protein [Pseudolabrys sp.]|jgi:cytosine/adenosine deaminase-related metal-dependent hydrolase|nr:amidohydrolase family protein [Pseudolabrys sp.]
MCQLCDAGFRQNHFGSRRSFLKGAAATGIAAAGGLKLFAPRPAAADAGGLPNGTGMPGRRYLLRNASVMSMDPAVGDFSKADVLIEGKKIVAVAPNLQGSGAAVIDVSGRIVMPGFIDTHHHQFETAMRGWLADGVLIGDNSGSPSGSRTYYENILLKFSPVYRPQDVYINELFAGLSQLDDGVTTVHDVSQIHHSPQHSDAAIQALIDTGRRAAFGYFEGAGQGVVIVPPSPKYAYPQDATRIIGQWFGGSGVNLSSNGLVHMIMGGEVYLGNATTQKSWTIGRQLNLQIGAHILSPFGIRPILDALAAGHGGGTDNPPGNPGNGNIAIGPDNLFIHMTGMSDAGWQGVKNAGAQVSIAFPIEMNMRHGMPPILKMKSLGMEPSLSVDVECTMTADFFTQMRVAMNMERELANQMILNQSGNSLDLEQTNNWGLPPSAAANPWPTPSANQPALLTTRDVLRYATMNGAKALRLDGKVGSLTPGKEADIIVLDATALNVAPLNHVPGAVVSLMDRTNVETVIVAGKVRKWKGQLLDVNLDKLRSQLEASRDFIFNAAGIPQDLFAPF